MPNDYFHFKQFTVRQERCALKVGTDGVLLGAWTDFRGAGRILDIGTGTGLLALIAAQRNPTAMIDAVEIDAASVEQTVENMRSSPWKDRLRAHHLDIRRMTFDQRYDLIICNPPFYAGVMGSRDRRTGIAKHGEELTYAELMHAVDSACAGQGRFTVVVPLDREADLLDEAEPVGFGPTKRCVVRYVAHKPPKRVMLELARSGNGVPEEEEIVVEEAGPARFSARYGDLMSDLLLKF